MKKARKIWRKDKPYRKEIRLKLNVMLLKKSMKKLSIIRKNDNFRKKEKKSKRLLINEILKKECKNLDMH